MRIHQILPWQDVVGIVGPLEDDRIAAIIATGASVEDIARAKALADGTDQETVGEAVAKVYDILTADGKVWRER